MKLCWTKKFHKRLKNYCLKFSFWPSCGQRSTFAEKWNHHTSRTNFLCQLWNEEEFCLSRIANCEVSLRSVGFEKFQFQANLCGTEKRIKIVCGSGCFGERRTTNKNKRKYKRIVWVFLCFFGPRINHVCFFLSAISCWIGKKSKKKKKKQLWMMLLKDATFSP